MKKILFLLLCTVQIYGQTSTGQEQEFDYGIKNNSTQTITTPTYLTTTGMDGTQGKIPSAYIAKTADVADSLATKENIANKSDSYTVSSSTTYASTKAIVDGLATKAPISGSTAYLPTNGNSLTTSRLRNFGDQINANALTGGGAMWNYGQNGAPSNIPSGFIWGSVFQFNSQDTDDLALQFANNINHNVTTPTRDLYFRSKNNLAWQDDWKKLWHDGNFNPANYLPLSGGTLTGIVTAPTAAAGTNTTQIATTAFVLANSSTRPYKVYTALLSQSGTSAPTATVLENTLGGTIVWTRSNIGQYVGTLTGAFTDQKTIIFVNRSNPSATAFDTNMAANVININTVGYTTFSNSAYVDGQTNSASIEIRVYL